jgi:holo-[acyl-carrier protein] synthase
VTRIRVGCDLVSVAEVGRSIELFGQRYLRRVYTEAELAACTGPTRVHRLAARFAAKEATAKVLGELDGPLPWHTIEVRADPSGRPELALSGHAAALATAQRLADFDVSLSHEGGLAMAMVVASAGAAGGRSGGRNR